MTKLIDDLLDYSRISRSGGEFVKTDLNKIIEEVMVDFDVVVNQKKAKVNIDKLPILRLSRFRWNSCFTIWSVMRLNLQRKIRPRNYDYMPKSPARRSEEPENFIKRKYLCRNPDKR